MRLRRSHEQCGNPIVCSYFHLDSNKPEPVKLQTGVVRTNCMDNLDRTNVAQAAIAKWTLNRQLKDLRVIQENDSVDNYDELARDFRESAFTWIQNLGYILTSFISVGGSCQRHLHRVQRDRGAEDRFHADRQAHSQRFTGRRLQFGRSLPQK